MADKALLERLAEYHILAIATGRPKYEADIALDHHDIRRYFSAVFTLEDCIREENRILEQEGRRVSLSKPEPYMLDAIAESIRPRPVIAYYLGDMPDDMIAAGRSRTGFVGFGLATSAPDKQILRSSLLRAGADYIIEDLKQVEEIVAV
jgi:phosphoglycolate phosphatase-like HAD superfamily hydrolase